jgi:hypothetical protein
MIYLVYIFTIFCADCRLSVRLSYRPFFVGEFAYANDLALLASSVSAMCRVLAICDEFAHAFQVYFNAQKPKCIISLSNVVIRDKPNLVFQIGNERI